MTRRTCILVSPYFPPSSVAGVHRARHLAKHLPDYGWQPIVVCVDERHHEHELDPDLARLVPASVESIKLDAVPLWLTRPFGLGEISIRAWLQLRAKLIELLASRQVDLVFITGSPYFPMLFAAMIERDFEVPVVLDFQDPWVSDWGASQSVLTKAGVAHGLAVALEPIAVRGSSFITSVSSTQNEQMRERYPWIGADRMAAIPIGGDPEDFDALRERERPVATQMLASQPNVNLSFVGTFMPRTGPVLRVVFRAFGKLREFAPELAKRLMFNFVGTSNQPNEGVSPVVLGIAEEEGVVDSVFEHPMRIPYLDALSCLARSDGILLIGSDERHYTASKIYPALMSGRPYLAVFHRDSSSHHILAEAQGGLTFGFTSGNELAVLTSEIADGLYRFVDQPSSLGKAKRASFEEYEASGIARTFASVFDRVCSN